MVKKIIKTRVAQIVGPSMAICRNRPEKVRLGMVKFLVGAEIPLTWSISERDSVR